MALWRGLSGGKKTLGGLICDFENTIQGFAWLERKCDKIFALSIAWWLLERDAMGGKHKVCFMI